MKHFSFTTSASALAIGLAALGLAACNDQNLNATPVLTTPTTPTMPVAMTTVSGVAATGATISGGAVALRCANGATASTTSAADGRWSTSVPSSALPCAVQVSGGTPAGTFYSIARSASGTASTANLTPISDLALASAVNAAVGTAVNAWYTNATDAQRQQVADGINTAIASLRTALVNAGYSLPPGEGFDPFTAAITAGAATDAYDQLLEAYKQALADAGKTYESARSDYTAGAGVPGHASTPTTPPDDSAVSGPLTATGSANATEFLGKLAGDYKLLVADAYAAGESEFAKGSVHAVQMKADGTVSIRGSSKTISYTYAQKTLSDYTQDNAGVATEKDTLRFYAANGGSIDLFITYEPGQGYLTITPQGFTGESEGGATLVSKKGTPTTPPTNPPPASVGKGILGAALNSVFAGDYVLKCSVSPGQAVRTFAFSIAGDGSSVFEGAPLVDATHAGNITTEGVLSSNITMKFAPKAADTAYVVLGFRSGGTFAPNSVFVPGQPNGQVYSCNNPGNTAPAAASRALASIPEAAAALARSETLNCRQGGATTPQTLTISSDGSAQLGSQSFAAATLFNITDRLLFGGAGQKGTVQYSDTSNGGFRLLAIDFDADLKTTGVLAGVGTGPNDSISCTP